MRILLGVENFTPLLLCVLMATACSNAAYRTDAVTSVSPGTAAGSATATATVTPIPKQKYIIQLQAAPLADYAGGLPGLAATSPEATGGSLDLNSPASRAYIAYLGAQQQKFIASMQQALGRRVAPLFIYFYALNGMAVKLTAAEATQVAKLPGVVSVHEDMARKPL